MNRNRYVFMFLAAVAAGSLGGTFSRAALSSPPVLAQAPLPPKFAPKLLRAHAFELVDEAGHIRGVFAVGSDNAAAIQLYDTEGRVIWSTGRTGIQPAGTRR